MKRVSLSVQEFALPSPLSGSIEGGSGFLSNAAEKGIELHQLIQEERTRDFPDYKSEVSCGHVFEDEYVFAIAGRMDGVFDGSPPLIEEIKSSFNVYDLQKSIREKWMEHPYVLQLMTYGYFYWKKHNVLPNLSLHLISSRNQDRLDLEVKLNLRSYEEWLDRRLGELKSEAALLEKRIERRKKISKNFPFPFENPRPG